MSIGSSPSIVTNGLVFNYDMNNNKSYRSPPIKNVLNQITPRGLSSGALYNFTSGTENVYIPGLGWINNCQYVDMYNDYNGGSNNCCPSPYGYGDSLVVSPSTLYTYAIVYKSTNGYTHPNYMYHYEFTSGGSYLTEYGVFGNNGSTAKIRSLGDDWYWASATFTSNASAGLMNTGSWMYEYGRYNRFHVAKAMLVPGNYIDMHPKFWPALDTTVTNTQTILDLTNQNTITATSLTYASDGTFSFNGSSDYLTIPNTTLGNGNIEWTVSCWMKTTTTTNSLGGGSVLSNISGGPVYSMMGVNNGKIVYWTYQNNAWAQKLGTGKTVNDGNWHMLTWVNYANYTMDMYVDGLLDSNVANSTSGNNNPVDVIGRSWAAYFPGSIASMSRYSRALTRNEVFQNFAAQRGLYGV
jgi:hypothetical protein